MIHTEILNFISLSKIQRTRHFHTENCAGIRSRRKHYKEKQRYWCTLKRDLKGEKESNNFIHHLSDLDLSTISSMTLGKKFLKLFLVPTCRELLFPVWNGYCQARGHRISAERYALPLKSILFFFPPKLPIQNSLNKLL